MANGLASLQGDRDNAEDADCEQDVLEKQWHYLGSGVAQLAEQLLPKPEVCGSNPVIGKKL